MKKTIAITLLALLCLSLNTNRNHVAFNFVGEWIGTDESNKTGSFIFSEDGNAIIKVNGVEMGGKDHYVNGKKVFLHYTVDQTVQPIQMDFIAGMENDTRGGTIFGIAKIIDDNKIQIALGLEGSRPTAFNKDITLDLTRVKK